jgi:hypothetical protein
VYVPRIVLSLLILALGTYFARFVGNAVAAQLGRGGRGEGEALGKLARYAVLAFVLVVAFDQLEIGSVIVRTSFLILLGGFVFAVALAFGLGGRRWAAARLEEWWPTDK